MLRFPRLLIAAAALAALAGCVHTEDRNQPCPVGGILGDAETASAFNGAAAPANLIQRTTLTNVSISCSYDSAQKDGTHKRLDAALSFDIVVERGPAARPGSVTVPYFVAVSRNTKAILARESFSRTFDLAREPRASARERIDRVRIPLAPKTTGASYEVIVGLAVTPEQLAQNRARHSPN